LKEVAIWKQLFSLLGRTDNRKIGLTGIENKLQSAVELMGYSLTLLKKNGWLRSEPNVGVWQLRVRDEKGGGDVCKNAVS